MASFPLAHQISTQGQLPIPPSAFPFINLTKPPTFRAPNNFSSSTTNNHTFLLILNHQLRSTLTSCGLFSSTDLIETFSTLHFLLRNLSQWRVSWPLLSPPISLAPQHTSQSTSCQQRLAGIEKHSISDQFESSTALLTFFFSSSCRGSRSSRHRQWVSSRNPRHRLTASPTSRARSCELHPASFTTNRIVIWMGQRQRRTIKLTR